jgi:hypothetical protein
MRDIKWQKLLTHKMCKFQNKAIFLQKASKFCNHFQFDIHFKLRILIVDTIESQLCL